MPACKPTSKHTSSNTNANNAVRCLQVTNRDLSVAVLRLYCKKREAEIAAGVLKRGKVRTAGPWGRGALGLGQWPVGGAQLGPCERTWLCVEWAPAAPTRVLPASRKLLWRRGGPCERRLAPIRLCVCVCVCVCV